MQRRIQQVIRQVGGNDAPPMFDPRIGLTVVPVVIYWLTRQVASGQIAIAAGFTASLFVFFVARQRGAIGLLAITGMVIVGGSAAIGIAADSEKAYLANDPAGDILFVVMAAGSLIWGRPLIGVLAREMSPPLRDLVPVDHTVFVRATILWAVANAGMAAIRIVLLDSLSVDGYLLATRAVSWPLNLALFGVTFLLIARAAAASAQAPAPVAAPVATPVAAPLDR